MKKFDLTDMTRGWFVGDFEPAAIKSSSAEAAVRHYAAGDKEAWHYHKVATEITVVVSGRVRMCGGEHGPGAILVIEPGEGTDFEALTDAVTTVVKLPSVRGDKYLEE